MFDVAQADHFGVFFDLLVTSDLRRLKQAQEDFRTLLFFYFLSFFIICFLETIKPEAAAALNNFVLNMLNFRNSKINKKDEFP